MLAPSGTPSSKTRVAVLTADDAFELGVRCVVVALAMPKRVVAVEAHQFDHFYSSPLACAVGSFEGRSSATTHRFAALSHQMPRAAQPNRE